MSRDDYDRDRRRRRFDDDDRDRRPRPSRNRGGISPLTIGLLAGGAALTFVVVAVVLYFVVFRDSSRSGGVFGPSPPPGYSVVPGDMAGFTCYLPGEARSIRVAYNGVPGEQAGIYG
jgi:hypothetical protein